MSDFKEVNSDIQSYIKNYHEEEILEFLNSGIETKESLNIDLCILQKNAPKLFEALLFNTWDEVSSWNEALQQLQHELKDNSHTFIQDNYTVKHHIFARFVNSPIFRKKDDIRNAFMIKVPGAPYPDHNTIGELVEFKGIIMRKQEQQTLEIRREYNCKKCNQTFRIASNYNETYEFNPTYKCTNEDCKKAPLKQKEVEEVPDWNDCLDFQQLTVQELQKNSFSAKTVLVTIDNELVDRFQAGERVIVCGKCELRWSKNEPTLYVRALSVQKDSPKAKINKNMEELLVIMRANFEEELEQLGELTLRDCFIESLSPDTQGMHIIKLGVALLLCSCSDNDFDDTSRTRGASHMLMIGDPGLGKSQLMKAATEAAHVAVTMTGFGCTEAGLLAGAYKDEGMWQLEPGALVLADKGILVIDEFSMMHETHQESLLQAMEQQCVNIAKAGVVAKMNARCSIIAGMNPKNKTGVVEQDGSVILGMHGALLSRFDLVFVLKQQKDLKWQKKLIDFLFDLDHKIEKDDLWSSERLQAHVLAARTLDPSMDDDVFSVIRAYFSFYRLHPERDQLRTTARFLESLIRLTKAHARLVLRNKTKIVDAVQVIFVMEGSYSFGKLFDPGNIIQSKLPMGPWKEDVRMVLERLSLEHLIETAFAETDFKDQPFEPPTSPKTSESSQVPSLNFTWNTQASSLRGSPGANKSTSSFQSFWNNEGSNFLVDSQATTTSGVNEGTFATPKAIKRKASDEPKIITKKRVFDLINKKGDLSDGHRKSNEELSLDQTILDGLQSINTWYGPSSSSVKSTSIPATPSSSKDPKAPIISQISHKSPKRQTNSTQNSMKNLNRFVYDETAGSVSNPPFLLPRPSKWKLPMTQQDKDALDYVNDLEF